MTQRAARIGDWTVSRDVFPNGLRPLADEVHRLGMQFGLWVEPEMVNPDSDLYRAHADRVLHFAGRPRTEQPPADPRPRPAGVVAQLETVLARLVEENAVDSLKWDMNGAASKPGSVAGKAIWRRHAEAVYALLDWLRALPAARDRELLVGRWARRRGHPRARHGLLGDAREEPPDGPAP